MQTAVRNTTFARVSFFTHEPYPLNRIDLQEQIPKVGELATTSLVGFSFNKHINQPYGSVTIDLKPRQLINSKLRPDQNGKLWTELLNQGDWWLIEIEKNGRKYVLSHGMIDRIANVTATAGRGVRTVTQISGRDFAFALSDLQVYFNPADPSFDNVAGVNMSRILGEMIGSPSKIVTTIVKAFSGTLIAGIDPEAALPWGMIEVPGGIMPGETGFNVIAKKWGNAITYATQAELRGQTLLADLIQPSEGGSVWDVAKQWSNPSMNEMFVDVSPFDGRPSLIVRENPFENFVSGIAPWEALTAWEVDARVCNNINLTKGANRLNYIQFSGYFRGILKEGSIMAYPPCVNRHSMLTYGIKRLEEVTDYMDDDTLTLDHGVGGVAREPGPPFALGFRQWLGSMVAWNALNHLYYSGSISMPEIRPEIRIGERIRLNGTELAGIPRSAFFSSFSNLGKMGEQAAQAADDASEQIVVFGENHTLLDTASFYVEGVSVKYQTGEQPTCSMELAVTRGFPDELRMTALADEGLNWTVVSAAAPIAGANFPFDVGLTDFLTASAEKAEQAITNAPLEHE